MALKFNIWLTLALIFQFTPSIIFVKSIQLLNKIGSQLQLYYKNFSFQLCKSENGGEKAIFVYFELLEPNNELQWSTI